jgi:hypothetical protein
MEVKVKVENYPFIDTVDIFISRIDCTPKNIANLIDVFEFKKNIEIVADMGFADEESFSIEKIQNFKFKHKASFEKSKYSNGLFRLIAISNECKEFLKDVFSFDVENIAIYSINDESLLGQNLSYDMARRLIKQKIMDVFIAVTVYDSGIVITLNKDAYDAKQLVAKIKSIL